MEQKVWLITGVSKGLGKELARLVINAGDIVIGTVRKEVDKNAFERNDNAKAVIIDLAKTEMIPSLIDTIIQQYGRIDVLVNNAGFGAFGMLEEFDEKEVVHQFQVNFNSVLKLCQTVIPHMRQNAKGTIVQISSRAGIMAGVGNGIYASSKFALEGMSEALKQEVESFGIKVLLVEPGALRTDFFGTSVQYAAKKLDLYVEKSGNIRANTKSLDGKQPGDPAKASQAIINAVSNNVPIFRLPLTSGAIQTIKAKIAELEHCLLMTEEIANSIDY